MSHHPHEINGDDALSFGPRLAYLAVNLRRNLSGVFVNIGDRHWQPTKLAIARHGSFSGSPGRVLMDIFLAEQLPNLVAPGPVRALEVGCGSGRLRFLLAQLGYSGGYTGIDIDKQRFDSSGCEAFPDAELIVGDAASVALNDRFDLAVSVSALEHVPNDIEALLNIEKALAPGGLQVHLVPTGSALFLYLWHGLRQYHPKLISERFPSDDRQVFRLGGLFSYLLHFLVITCLEVLMRVRLRRLVPRPYAWINRWAIRFDRYCPFPASTAVIVQKRATSGASN